VHRHRKVHSDPARSETPCIYASTLSGNREIPRLSADKRAVDRVGSRRTYADDERKWEVGIQEPREHAFALAAAQDVAVETPQVEVESPINESATLAGPSWLGGGVARHRAPT
jgi:hypothetical protein